MRWSDSFVFTLKEAPHDAEIVSHQLLIRAGLVKKLAPGIYTYGPLFLRALRKWEAIIREEMNRIGALEIFMPMVQPRALWEETNRWQEMGEGLLKFKNRNDQWFCLGATHEEAVTDYIRHDIRSWKQLPKALYQIQTKYRDEIRPRFGLMRGREFLMKDAYSFDLTPEAAQQTYWRFYGAYKSIFDRLGVEYRIVQADSGNIGGSLTHEFQLLAQSGEDALLVSDATDFAANVEVCPVVLPPEDKVASGAQSSEMRKISTPGIRTIEELSKFLDRSSAQLVKTLFVNAAKNPEKDFVPVAVLLRGDHEVNPVKLKNALGLTTPPPLLSEDQVLLVSGAKPGSCGPVGLKIPVYVDQSVTRLSALVVGANQDDFHLEGVVMGRDFQAHAVGDYRMAQEGDLDPTAPERGRLKLYRGIEVGHVFYLGTKYSKAMKAFYTDAAGEQRPIEMGCYGIGVTRTLQAVIEQRHDADGIIWPWAVAPFLVHIVVLDPKDAEIMAAVNQWEKELEARGIDVFVDDREDERPGVKFKDADLLGFPLRLTVGQKSKVKGVVEFKPRASKEVQEISWAQVVEYVERVIAAIKQMK